MYVGRGRSVGRLSLSGKAFFFARSSHRYGGCTKLAAAATQYISTSWLLDMGITKWIQLFQKNKVMSSSGIQLL